MLSLAFSFSLFFSLFLSLSVYHHVSSLVFPSAYGSVEEILVILGLDIIPGTRGQTGLWSRLHALFLRSIRSTAKWPVIRLTFDSGEIRFLARRMRRESGRNSQVNIRSTVSP